MNTLKTIAPRVVPERARNFFDDFKAFALQGSIVDLAVGVVIGTAFNAVVNSLVNDMIMPAIAGAFGKPDFTSIVLGNLKVGSFVTSILNFVIIAFSVFITLKVFLRYKLPQKEKEETSS